MKVLVSLSVAALLFVTACKNKTPKHNEETTDTATTEETTATPEPEVETTTDSTAEAKNAKVKISTEYGDMVLKLYDETPKHRDNFIKLAKDGFYKDLLFHRVINGFMIQGGDPTSRGAAPNVQLGSGGPGYTVPAEFNPKFIHKKGALSAARQGDQVNPRKESSGSQFYIVQGQVQTPQQLQQMSTQTGVTYTPEQIKTYSTIGGTPFLDMQYTVFGEVVEGMEVIDKIASVQTAPGDRPIKDVKFNVTVIEGEN